MICKMVGTILGKVTVDQMAGFVHGNKSISKMIGGGDNSKLMYAKNMLSVLGMDKNGFSTILLLSHLRETRPDLYGFVMKEHKNKVWFDNQVKEIKNMLWG